MVRKNVCDGDVLPKVEKYVAQVYNEAEVAKFMELIKGTDMELPMMLDLVLGLRRSELLALKWEHIDFENSIIHIKDNRVEVKKSISKERVVTKDPKSKSGKRDIPITDSFVAFLKNARKVYLENKMRLGSEFYDGDYVVCQHDGKPYKPASMSSKFNKFLKKHNLKHIRLHDIRHTNATLMLAKGIATKTAQERLGHSDFSTTMNTYSHVLDSVAKDAANTIEDVLFTKIGG